MVRHTAQGCGHVHRLCIRRPSTSRSASHNTEVLSTFTGNSRPVPTPSPPFLAVAFVLCPVILSAPGTSDFTGVESQGFPVVRLAYFTWRNVLKVHPCCGACQCPSHSRWLTSCAAHIWSVHSVATWAASAFGCCEQCCCGHSGHTYANI